MSFNIFSLPRNSEDQSRDDMMTPYSTEIMDPFKNNKEALIAWVNHLEYPNCLLATDINDFKNVIIKLMINVLCVIPGVIFCELVNEIILNNQKPDFLPKIKLHNPNYEESLKNVNMAITEIKAINKSISIPEEIMSLTDIDLLKDENKILMLLQFLNNIAINNPLHKNDSPSKHLQAGPSESDFSDMMMGTNYRMPNQSYNPLSTMNTIRSTVGLAPTIKKPPKHILKKSEEFNASQAHISKLLHPNHDYSPVSMGPLDKINNPFHHPIADNFPQYSFLPHSNDTTFSNNTTTNTFSKNSNTFSKNSKIAVNDFIDPDCDYINNQAIAIISPNNNENDLRNTNNIFLSNSKYNSSNVDEENSLILEGRIPFSRMIDIENKSSLTQGFINQSKNSNNESFIYGQTENHPSSSSSGYDSKKYNSRTSNEITEESQKKDYGDDKMRLSPLGVSKKFHQNIEKQRNVPENIMALSIRKPMINDENIIITAISQQTKDKLTDWLCSMKLTNENAKKIDQNIRKFCQNGRLFIDLIEKLEGKSDLFKGSDTSTTQNTIYSNFIKLADYLRQYEKMNHRYLNAYQYLVNGNPDVFWGFLDDIWYLYTNKSSNNDIRMGKDTSFCADQTPKSKPLMHKAIQKSFTRSDSKENTKLINLNGIDLNDKSKSIQTKPLIQPKLVDQTQPIKQVETDNNTNNTTLFTQGKDHETMIPIKIIALTKQRTPSSIEKSKLFAHPNKNALNKSMDITNNMNGSVTINNNNNENLQQIGPIASEIENDIYEWLKSNGFKSLLIKKDKSILEDPFRNGILLCYIITLIENEKVNGIYQEPQNTEECILNMIKAFTIFKKKNYQIPSYLLANPELIIQGNKNIIWNILHYLMKIHQKKSTLVNEFPKTSERTYEIPTLPYTEEDLKLLEYSIIAWLYELGLLNETISLSITIEELLSMIKNGVILGDLVNIVLKTSSLVVFRKPNNESQCIANIKKCLEALRNEKNMSQVFTSKEKEVYLENKMYVLGLLEDLHRYFDGQPPRFTSSNDLNIPYIGYKTQIKPNDRSKAFHLSESQKKMQNICLSDSEKSPKSNFPRSAQKSLTTKSKVVQKFTFAINSCYEETTPMQDCGKKFLTEGDDMPFKGDETWDKLSMTNSNVLTQLNTTFNNGGGGGSSNSSSKLHNLYKKDKRSVSPNARSSKVSDLFKLDINVLKKKGQ